MPSWAATLTPFISTRRSHPPHRRLRRGQRDDSLRVLRICHGQARANLSFFRHQDSGPAGCSSLASAMLRIGDRGHIPASWRALTSAQISSGKCRARQCSVTLAPRLAGHRARARGARQCRVDRRARLCGDQAAVGGLSDLPRVTTTHESCNAPGALSCC